MVAELIRRVVVVVDGNRRVVAYPGGGLHLEAFVAGVGWVLDDQAEVSDSVLLPLLEAARDALVAACDQLAPTQF